MLNVGECIEKAHNNKDFVLDKLMGVIDSHPDWVSIVAFYSALHFVNAHRLKHHSIQREHHEERETEVSTHMPEIYVSYKRLFDMGFRARYMSVQDNPTPEEAESAIKYELTDIENFVMERLQ